MRISRATKVQPWWTLGVVLCLFGYIMSTLFSAILYVIFRIPLPGLSYAIQSPPMGNSDLIGGGGPTCALTQVPVITAYRSMCGRPRRTASCYESMLRRMLMNSLSTYRGILFFSSPPHPPQPRPSNSADTTPLPRIVKG
ncbi:hypothetical protein Tco_0629536 [Tanacetum coccineum]|uniref:Uncharacterized protein n=1 Tax=Tanacetum coccineum TaxID=301880 RepID=A0ABQ4WTD0_9ASTR